MHCQVANTLKSISGLGLTISKQLILVVIPDIESSPRMIGIESAKLAFSIMIGNISASETFDSSSPVT